MTVGAEDLAREPVGFFGKLPSHGDFVTRGLRESFLNAWDSWLQRVIAGSQQRLGSAWVPAYMTSPLWRFVLSEDVIDGACWAGVLMPSVDRVGRNFPFTIATEIARGTRWLAWVDARMEWFAAVEELALELLDQDVLDLDATTARIALPGALAFAAEPRQLSDEAVHSNHVQWTGKLSDVGGLTCALAETLLNHAEAKISPVSLWWTSGSERLSARWELLRALPTADDFTRMLDGSALKTPSVLDPNATPRPLASEPRFVGTVRHWQASAITHPGHVRSQNQDAWLSRPDAGCWAVADGMGGHQYGDRASRLLIQQINAALWSRGSLPVLRQQVRDAVQRAHVALWEPAARDPQAEIDSGSTLVALVASHDRACVMWAGDSRLYRWRRGTLESLTRDHVAYEDADRPAAEITRAIGVTEKLELEEREFAIEAGDRYLLCSDGVHGALSEWAIKDILGRSASALEASALIERAVLAGPAADNLTAVALWVELPNGI